METLYLLKEKSDRYYRNNGMSNELVAYFAEQRRKKNRNESFSKISNKRTRGYSK